MTTPDPLASAFFRQAARQPAVCRHIWKKAYYVTRHYPGTVTVCRDCHKPLKFTPDGVITDVQTVTKERIIYRDPPPQMKWQIAATAGFFFVLMMGLLLWTLG